MVPDESKEILSEGLDDEDYDLITSSDDVTEFKFKVVELFNDFRIKVASS